MRNLSDYVVELQKKSPWIVSHMNRVRDLCRTIGIEEDDILLAAGLHDLGKLYVPSGMLEKNGSLDGKERQQMKRHCEYAFFMIPSEGVAEIVRCHHENFDGSGYFGLKGDEIPYGSRVIAVADAFDALISDRPYRKRYDKGMVLDIMSNESHKYDPSILNQLYYNI